MNEIEKAIEHFRYGITHDIFGEPVTTYARLAVDALREKAEREKGGRAMTIHKLKLSPIYYDDSASGIKTFEIRKNDRNFKVGDILELREWVWSGFDGKGTYTGNVHWKVITYILDDEEYLHDGYVCLAVSPIAEPEEVEP